MNIEKLKPALAQIKGGNVASLPIHVAGLQNGHEKVDLSGCNLTNISQGIKVLISAKELLRKILTSNQNISMKNQQIYKQARKARELSDQEKQYILERVRYKHELDDLLVSSVSWTSYFDGLYTFLYISWENIFHILEQETRLNYRRGPTLA